MFYHVLLRRLETIHIIVFSTRKNLAETNAEHSFEYKKKSNYGKVRWMKENNENPNLCVHVSITFESNERIPFETFSRIRYFFLSETFAFHG